MSAQTILKQVEQYYTSKIREHGPTPAGVDWSSSESQILRFEQFLRLWNGAKAFTINDYGCGYGALADYLGHRNFTFQYRGFDVSDEMVVRANRIHAALPGCTFFSDPSQLEPADYTVASGIFNVKLDTPKRDWVSYMLRTVRELSALSTRGFAFNVLTRHSDPERMRPDLYYADPAFFFDYCKSALADQVALLHDYGLYEFTVLARK